MCRSSPFEKEVQIENRKFAKEHYHELDTQYKTSLRCGACIAKLKPYLDETPCVVGWEVDLASPDKLLKIDGDLRPQEVIEIVSRAGYQVLDEVAANSSVTSVATSSTNPDFTTTYFPLVLLVSFLLGIVAIVELRTGSFSSSRAMGNFMGAIFVAFSFFKLLDLPGFAESFRTYDVVVQRFPVYGYAYPFIELILGIAYILDSHSFATNLFTVVVMSVSSIGVILSLLNKRTIRCVCLGTIFILPMSTVTLVENGLMLCMAAVALLAGGR